jgi:hypothetical protein
MRPIHWPLVALALAALTTVAATPTPAGDPGQAPVSAARPPGACAGPPARPAATAPGAWWRLDPLLDRHGALVGQSLRAGNRGGPGFGLRLAAESFAAGPVGNLVLYGTDDGRRSELALLDLARGCTVSIGTEPRAVIRRAVLDGSAGTVYEFRVERRTRRDLGVWRRPLDGRAAPTRVLGPIGRDARFGMTWATELGWADDGRLLVTSCGASACRSRLLDAGSGAVTMIDEPDLGEPLGVADGRYVAYLACRGLPCPISAVDLRSGRRETIATTAVLAALVPDLDGRARLVHEVAGEEGLTVLDLRGRRTGRIERPDGRLVPSAIRARGAIALPAGWFPISADGRVDPDGGIVIFARDGRRSTAAEVSR